MLNFLKGVRVSGVRVCACVDAATVWLWEEAVKNVLWCSVAVGSYVSTVSSRVHFRSQVQHVGKQGCWTMALWHCCYKSARTSECESIHQDLLEAAPYCLCQAWKWHQEEAYLLGSTPPSLQTHWEEEAGPLVDDPLSPDTRLHLFLRHAGVQEEPVGWIMCQAHCSCSQTGLCEPLCVSKLCPIPAFPCSISRPPVFPHMTSCHINH